MIRAARLLALAALLLAAACDGEGSGDGSASLTGTFDGEAVSSEDGVARAEAVLQGDFLDVTVVLELPDERYGAVLVIEGPGAELVGEALAIGGGVASATVFRGDEAPRAATGGSVTFDVLDPVPGGVAAGSYDLDFPGGSFSGDFDASVE